MGVNGSGKTTVIHAIACAYQPPENGHGENHRFSDFFIPNTDALWKGSEFHVINERIDNKNYRHFSHLYALGERFDMTFTDRYTPFDPVQSLDVHLTLNNVRNGSYLVRETTVSRKSGSAFDLWVEMGAMEPDSQQELAVLEAHSIPKCSKYLAQAKNHTLELDAMLDMLEVRLITIEPTHNTT